MTWMRVVRRGQGKRGVARHTAQAGAPGPLWAARASGDGLDGLLLPPLRGVVDGACR